MTRYYGVHDMVIGAAPEHDSLMRLDTCVSRHVIVNSKVGHHGIGPWLGIVIGMLVVGLNAPGIL